MHHSKPSLPNVYIKLEQWAEFGSPPTQPGRFCVTLSPHYCTIDAPDDVSISIDPPDGLTQEPIERMPNAMYKGIIVAELANRPKPRHVEISVQVRDLSNAYHKFHSTYLSML